MPELHSPSPVETPPPPISATLDVQKHDLPPEVRSYADNLEAQVQAIFTEHGCTTWEEFQVLAQDSQRIPIEKMKEVSLLIQTLARVTEHPEVQIPEIERTKWFKDWYKKLGFDIDVPIPNIRPDEIERRSKLEIPQALFYRPPTKDMSYEDFMTAVGQGDDWTIRNQDSRTKIGWESTETGYWYWAEVDRFAPRDDVSWDDLDASIRLLSLEEYVILWRAHYSEMDIDFYTGNFLRTKCGSGVLSVHEEDAEIRVKHYFGTLAAPVGTTGGRASEIVSPRP